MKSIVFNDPYSDQYFDHLRYLFMYYDEVVTIDNTRFTNILKEIIRITIDNCDIQKLTSGALRKNGIDLRTVDRNIRARVEAHIKAKAEQELLPELRKVSGDVNYWIKKEEQKIVELKNICDLGDIKLLAEPFNSGGLDLKTIDAELVREELRNFGFAGFYEAVVSFIGVDAKVFTSKIDGPVQFLAGALHLVALVIFTGLLVQKLGGKEVYTAHPSILSAINKSASSNRSIEARLNHKIFELELPVVTNVSFDRLHQIKYENSFVESRKEYQYKLETVCHEVNEMDFDSAKAEKKIAVMKRVQIDPELRDLRRLYKNRFRPDTAGSISAGLATSVVSVYHSWQPGDILADAVLNVVSPLVAGSVSKWFETSSKLTSSGLGYVVKLENRF